MILKTEFINYNHHIMNEEYKAEYNHEYKPDITNIINYIIRYEEHDKTECWIRINDTTYHIILCKYCGNYFDEKYANTKNLFCLCDRDSILYENYQHVINNFADYTSGDEIDDYIEYPEDANKDLMKYIYKIVLFGMTYKDTKKYIHKNYIHKNIDGYIETQILDYII